ncbi:ROK family transcriptional regulator [Amycolatopsis sp. VC5-11]|uniref:ROK family transcriptional regulator n=1 Tax=Amycolatopsis sp. VC5-11 TaxID=3120156 RepID=UPI00300A5C0E
MTPAKPSLDLLRSLTDEHVLRALLAERQLTRAQIAARTGISKPAVGDSVARLAEAGLLRDTGERTTGRGRVGTYYALADDLGTALVVSIGHDGAVAEAVDVFGEVLARHVEDLGRPVRPRKVAQALRKAAARVAADAGPLRLAVVSAADPVDRATGKLVHLPDSPFLLGELSPADVLAPVVAGPVTVDNDVNWAARTEQAAGDFAYLFLGEGLGCAVVADGEVRRGHAGLAGEIAHVLTRGADGQATTFIDVFADLGVRQPDSTTIDVAALRTAIKSDDVLDTLAEAICGVLLALVTVSDPELIVLGGPWGPDVLDAVSDRFAQLPRHVPLRAPRATDSPALTGARDEAVRALRSAVLTVSP